MQICTEDFGSRLFKGLYRTVLKREYSNWSFKSEGWEDNFSYIKQWKSQNLVIMYMEGRFVVGDEAV